MLGLGKKKKDESSMKALIQHVCEEMVEDPKTVTIEEICGSRSTIYEINCRSEDIGIMIGAQGRNIKAIRQIARSVSAKNREFGFVEVEVAGA